MTEFSGRGLGLGIVNEKVEKLSGQIFIETKTHVGTCFKIILPLTLATFRGIYVKASNRDFIIPTQHVKKVLRIRREEIKMPENKQTFTFDEKTLPFISLQDLLSLPKVEENSPDRDRVFVLIIKDAKTVIALGVDHVLNEKEILVKSLGKQLTHVRNIASASITETGKIIPILDPFDLIKSAIQASDRNIESPVSETEKKKKNSILIAEDSVTARILLKNILESAGYLVKTANDGIEALSLLLEEKFDLLLSDIEMPRMDGLTLTEKVRSNKELADLPVILCTSRESKEDRERGIEVGADAYIGKGTFSHANLLDIIQKLL